MSRKHKHRNPQKQKQHIQKPQVQQNQQVEKLQAVKTTPKKQTVEIKVPEVKIDPNEKIKRNMSLSVKNDYELEKLSDKIALPKSKIVDIILSKLLQIEINDEFDLYNIIVKKQ